MSHAKRILVVDDDASSRLVLTRSLERSGFVVLGAADGEEAEHVALTQQPDLILMDILMPGRDGLEICAALQSNPDTANIPVIFVTSATDSGRIVAAFEAGGSDYITKPFTRQELIARVSVHIHLRESQAALIKQNSALEDLTKELADLSRIDPLTRLLNRRAWDQAIAQEHQRYARSGRPYSVIMVDIDHFKAYNDLCGHQAGDECLRRVAETLGQTCRKVDSVGRYGGEEFVILTPETDIEAGPRFAERLRKAIWSLGIQHPGSVTAGRVTASVGVATSRGGNWEDVLREADEALYVAKRAGRNMVFAALDEKLVRMQKMQPQVLNQELSAPNGPLVMVVDDEPTNRAVCRGALRNAGYEVIEAGSGQEAIKLASEHHPDVILMDIMMPGMDGLECTQHLRSQAETSDIPVIVISALASNDDVVRGLEHGADEYLTKPIRATELTLRVRSMVRLHRERTDLLRSYETRGEHMRTLTQLVDYCRLVGLSGGVDGVLEATVEAVSEVGRSKRVSIMMPDETGCLRIAQSIGIPEEIVSTVKIEPGASVAGVVFREAKPIIANDNADCAIHGQRDGDIGSFASLPLVVTSHGGVTDVVGVLNVTQQRDDRPYLAHELEYLELISKISGSAIHNLQMRDAYDRASHSVMVALAKLAEYRDTDTGKHLDRVTRYSVMLAEALRREPRYANQIDDAFLDHLRRAVPLHDIGKVAIPDSILLHPGRLSKEQFETMKTHTLIGAETIQSLIDVAPQIRFLPVAYDIARYHHERFDGQGYPAGLRGEEIPLAARIASVADVYDALTTERVYKQAFSHEKAVEIILENNGMQFDPAVIEAFQGLLDRFKELAQLLRDPVPAFLETVDSNED